VPTLPFPADRHEVCKIAGTVGTMIALPRDALKPPQRFDRLAVELARGVVDLKAGDSIAQSLPVRGSIKVAHDEQRNDGQRESEEDERKHDADNYCEHNSPRFLFSCTSTGQLVEQSRDKQRVPLKENS
jgi:hypothetical protein